MFHQNNPSSSLFAQQQPFCTQQHYNEPRFGPYYEQPIYDYYEQPNMFHSQQPFGCNYVTNNQQVKPSSALRKRKRMTPVDSSDSDSDLDEVPPSKRYLSESLAKRLGKLNISNRKYAYDTRQMPGIEYYADQNYHPPHYVNRVTMLDDTNQKSSTYAQQYDTEIAPSMDIDSKHLVPRNFNPTEKVEHKTDDDDVDLELNLSDLAKEKGIRFPLYRSVHTPKPNMEIVPYKHPLERIDPRPKPKSSVIIEELDQDAEDFMDFEEDIDSHPTEDDRDDMDLD